MAICLNFSEFPGKGATDRAFGREGNTVLGLVLLDRGCTGAAGRVVV